MGADPERTMSGPEREYIKETYDVMLGTFKDYAEMIIQVAEYGSRPRSVPKIKLLITLV